METLPLCESLAIPTDLLAEIQAAADEERRSALDVLRDAVARYVTTTRRDRGVLKLEDPTEQENARIVASGMSPDIDHLNAKLMTPAEAVERILDLRQGNTLPEGVTIRDLMTHARA